MADENLNKAVTDAEVPEKEDETSVKEEPKKEPEKEVDDEEAEELEQARQLYKALKNPASAQMVIRAMAEKAGLLTPDASKTEKKEAKKAIAAIFKEHLGEKFGFMADEFGAAIEKVFEHYDSVNSERFSKIEQDRVKNTLDAAVEKLYSTYEDANKYEDRIFELMDEISAGEKTSPDAYLKRLYQIAKSEASDAATKDKIKKKIQNNSEDATARLTSSSSREGKTNTPTKALDLDDALEAAVASLSNKRE